METVQITHGPIRRRLLTPVTVTIPVAQSQAEVNLQRYIIRSLSAEMSSLILFALQSSAVVELAKYLIRYTSGSPYTLELYVRDLHRFCKWVGKTPDQLVSECKDLDRNPDPKVLSRHARLLEDFIGYLQADGLAPKTVDSHVKAVKATYRANGLRLDIPYRFSSRRACPDRAPTPEELQRLIDVADIRSKVIISCLALGGFREGTLCRLRYYHVKEDLERGIVPVHVHVEAEITKGKYHDYDTFVGREAMDYIKDYLELRRRGSLRDHIPSETLTDDSPLVRDDRSQKPRLIGLSQMYSKVHELYWKAGLLKSKRGRLYTLRPHSIRKFFRTQLVALGVDRDYIEYMMGHNISTYHDLQMKGIEFLRNVYAVSGLSIRPKTKLSKIEALKEIIRAWGLNPEQILTKEALSMFDIIHTIPEQRENEQSVSPSQALREMMRKELLNNHGDSKEKVLSEGDHTMERHTLKRLK